MTAHVGDPPVACPGIATAGLNPADKNPFPDSSFEWFEFEKYRSLKQRLEYCETVIEVRVFDPTRYSSLSPIDHLLLDVEAAGAAAKVIRYLAQRVGAER